MQSGVFTKSQTNLLLHFSVHEPSILKDLLKRSIEAKFVLSSKRILFDRFSFRTYFFTFYSIAQIGYKPGPIASDSLEDSPHLY